MPGRPSHRRLASHALAGPPACRRVTLTKPGTPCAIALCKTAPVAQRHQLDVFRCARSRHPRPPRRILPPFRSSVNRHRRSQASTPDMANFATRSPESRCQHPATARRRWWPVCVVANSRPGCPATRPAMVPPTAISTYAGLARFAVSWLRSTADRTHAALRRAPLPRGAVPVRSIGAWATAVASTRRRRHDRPGWPHRTAAAAIQGGCLQALGRRPAGAPTRRRSGSRDAR